MLPDEETLEAPAQVITMMAGKLGACTRALLLSAAQSLCNDFSSASSTSTLLSHFRSDHGALATAYEHGHHSLAPFLGRPFLGRSGVKEYFNMLQQYLTFSDMKFEDYVVDEVEKTVCVTGQARFVWKQTGRGWQEVFAYHLQYVDEDGKWKISRYGVWADSGSL